MGGLCCLGYKLSISIISKVSMNVHHDMNYGPYNSIKGRGFLDICKYAVDGGGFRVLGLEGAP